MSFKHYFDKAYCINLDRRTDRWEDAQKEFERVGIEVSRLSAVDGKSYTFQNTLKAGAYGCKLSHLKVLTKAVNKGYEKIFIAEDDIVFDDNFNEKFDNVSKNIPSNWDLIYLAANPFSGQRVSIADGVSSMVGGHSSHSILMKDTFFNKAIDAIHSMPQQVDVIYGILQNSFNCYVTIPHLAFQRNGFSDVEDQEINYDFFIV
jgi:hypothetical protein